MPITDTQFRNWLKDDAGSRCVLVHLSPYTPLGYPYPVGPGPELEGPQEASYYLSSREYITWSSDFPPVQPHDPCVVGVPTINRQLSQSFIGEATTTWGDLEVENTEGDKDSWLTELRWSGRGIIVWLGDMAWPFADFRKVFSGVIENIYVKDDKTLGFRIRDKRQLFDRPIQSNFISGTGTVNDGKPQPITAGYVFNIEPILINAALKIYQYHDDYVDPTGFAPVVRDNGVVVVGFTHQTGGPATITLTSAPAGRVTMDARGTGDPNYWGSALLERILTVKQVITEADYDPDFFTRLHTEETASDVSGIYIRDRMNVIDVMNAFSPGLKMWYGFTKEGLLTGGVFKPPENGTPVMTLENDDVKEGSLRHVSKSQPWPRVKVGYHKNWTPQDPGSLAGSVTPANRELYSAPYQVFSLANDHNVSGEDPFAPEPPVVETLLFIEGALTSSTAGYGAAGCALDLVGNEVSLGVYFEGLFSVPRDVWEVSITSVGFDLELGDIITLKYPRFGFENGLPVVVIGARIDPLSQYIVLLVWK